MIFFCVFPSRRYCRSAVPTKAKPRAVFPFPVELERLVDDVLACCELNAEALGIDAWHDMIAAVSHGFDGLGFRIVRMGHAFLAARNTGNARSKPDKGRNLSGSIQPPSGHYGDFSKHIHALAR